MSVIEELQTAVAAVAEGVGPSIVGIGRGTRGSGIVVADGKVLTNAHNLRGDEVTVTFADGRRTRGTVAGCDGDGDLAVIDVDTAGAAAVDWADGTGSRSGPPSSAPAPAMAAGRASPSASSRPSPAPSAGRAAGASRAASSTPHRSRRARPAAPLLTASGQLVGINTNRIGEGFYLALPADAALRSRVDALARGESPERPRLGVAVAPSHVARRMRRSVGLPERDGVLVRGVEDGSLAAAAGIESRRPDRRGRWQADHRRRRPPRGTRRSRAAVRAQGRARHRRADRPGRRRRHGDRRGLTFHARPGAPPEPRRRLR